MKNCKYFSFSPSSWTLVGKGYSYNDLRNELEMNLATVRNL